MHASTGGNSPISQAVNSRCRGRPAEPSEVPVYVQREPTPTATGQRNQIEDTVYTRPSTNETDVEHVEVYSD